MHCYLVLPPLRISTTYGEDLPDQVGGTVSDKSFSSISFCCSLIDEKSHEALMPVGL